MYTPACGVIFLLYYVPHSIDDVWRFHIFLKYSTWSQLISIHADRVANNNQYAPRQLHIEESQVAWERGSRIRIDFTQTIPIYFPSRLTRMDKHVPLNCCRHFTRFIIIDTALVPHGQPVSNKNQSAYKMY